MLVTAASRWSDFGSTANCWLSTRHGTVWGFIAPMLVIIVINAWIFYHVLKAVLVMRRNVHARRSSKDDTDKYVNIKKGFRASISFLFLLGITWVFGALAIGKASVAFFYLFALCNALQGVVIFIFQCYLDPMFVAI